MAAKPIDKSKTDAILVDWRIGRLSQRDIADKHKVSAGVVNKICKGVAQDVLPIVNAGVVFKQALSGHDERMVNAVHDAVDEEVRIKKFFRGAHMLVANTVANKVKTEGSNASFKDLSAAAMALKNTQESVLGKAPETVINNTNAVQTVINPSPEQLRQINEALENAC